MASNIRPVSLLVTALGIGLFPPAMAWTPYGHGPYGPGYRIGYPETALPEPPTGAGSYGLGLTPPTDRTGGYTDRWPPRYGPEAALVDPWEPVPPAPTDPGYGFPRRYPDSGGQGFAGPSGFRVSRATSDDAYTLTIALDGADPERVQIRTQGHWLLLSRTHAAQQIQKDSFDGGRRLMRSFSYSSGITNRRLAVPPDGILSAMSREDGKDSIRIRIPRRGRQEAGKE